MEYVLLGWPEDGRTLELDWRAFSYAGKFVMSDTGKAIARDGEEVVGAIAFNEDRTDETVLCIRYVTVRGDRQGEGIGSSLLAFGRDRAAARGYRRVTIAVNNPMAYEAAYRAGFGFTGETTGIAELRLAWPSDSDEGMYQAGLDTFGERDLPESQQAFIAERGEEPPDPVAVPTSE
jgi:GNAT superfamily N-acetyltransferase